MALYAAVVDASSQRMTERVFVAAPAGRESYRGPAAGIVAWGVSTYARMSLVLG